MINILWIRVYRVFNMTDMKNPIFVISILLSDASARHRYNYISQTAGNNLQYELLMKFLNPEGLTGIGGRKFSRGKKN
jgi:hypothetical protein